MKGAFYLRSRFFSFKFGCNSKYGSFAEICDSGWPKHLAGGQLFNCVFQVSDRRTSPPSLGSCHPPGSGRSVLFRGS